MAAALSLGSQVAEAAAILMLSIQICTSPTHRAGDGVAWLSGFAAHSTETEERTMEEPAGLNQREQ